MSAGFVDALNALSERREGSVVRESLAGEIQVISDVRTDPRLSPRMRALMEREQLRASLSAPLHNGEQVFGLFSVNYRATRAFGQREQRLLVALGQRAALAIENARLFEQAQQAATLQERQRLARELHDAVTQTLFSTALIAEVLPQLWRANPAAGQQRLEELRRLTRGALAEMRTLLVELRPGALTELPLAELLRQLAEATASRAPVAVAARIHGTPRALPAEVQVALYRLAQEALNNVVKHAEASQAAVTLEYEAPGGVRLQVEDDGSGFDPSTIPAGHLGVSIMRERAEAIGARFELASQPGGGTRIAIQWGSEGSAC